MDLGVKPISFTSSNALWKSGDGVSDQFPAGLRVLVVDDDPTCLRVLEKMLKNCLYEVTTCNRAEIALDFLRDNRNIYDIIVSDVHMPDMDGFKLLEHVGLEMDLPVIMMSADDSKSVVMKGVTHGACDYLVKPVRMEALKNIWQHVVRKMKHDWKDKDFEESGSMEEQKMPEDLDYSSSANEGNWNNPKKRKDEDDDSEDRDDISASKKSRVVWSVELHQQFVTAVNQLGIDKAVPKKILDLMNIPGLTRENVASHLQKYRLYLRRLSDVSQHHNGLPNSFLDPPDFPFGPTPSLNAVDLQALAASGHLPPQSLATIQAATLGWATAKNAIPSLPPLVDRRNIFSFENPKLRFLDGHPKQNDINSLHGIPTNMHVRSQTSQNNSLLMPMVQPQNFNEVNSSVSQPVLPRAAPSQPVLGRTRVDNVRGQRYNTCVSQPSIDFSSQSTDFSGSSFLLAGNTGMLSLTSKPREEVNAKVNGSRGFVPNYDVLGGPNRNRVAFSVAAGLGNTANISQQVNLSLGDNPLRIKAVPNMGFENGFLYEHLGQEDLMSALLKEQQEGVVPIENEFGFDGYYLDNLRV